ncbi:MAG: hypothetical protein HYZ29_03035 [Myxococcales bacterium]|nr:hypothetical protein [Myxococcales bacterium]
MNDLDHEHDERDLEALFDATAEAATGAQLTKLKARAADVPGRRRRPLWLLWAPFLAVAAGFFAVLMLRGNPEGEQARLPSATTTTSLQAPSVAGVAPTPAPPAEEPASDEGDETLAGLDDLDDGPSTDVLAAPLDDADEEELDVWLAAADSFLEEG